MLNPYIFKEREGNNVVPCLVNHFKGIGYFSGPNFGELNICGDSCAQKIQEQDYYLVYSMDIKDRISL